MKVRFFCDLFPHSAVGISGGVPSLFAMTTPQSGPTSTAVRVAFDVDIPDRLLPQPVFVPASAAVISEAGVEMSEFVGGDQSK